MSGSRQETVLIVDDDPQVRHLFSDMLHDAYDIVSVPSGEAAVQTIDEDVDVVLLDRRMPGLSGGEALSRLREKGYDVPVALVTAIEPDFDILELGFDDYVVKPVSEDELHNLVETLVIRNDYDEVMREYFSLVTKVTALERRKRNGELVANEEYREHSERLDDIKDSARAALNAAIDSGKFEELLKDLDTGERDG